MGVSIEHMVTTVNIYSALMFIFSLHGLSQQETAKRGNVFGISGMLMSIIALAISNSVFGHGYVILVIGIIVGWIIGFTMAAIVSMTTIPQMIALLHSFGGLAAFLASVAKYLDHETTTTYTGGELYVEKVFLWLGIIIGMTTFVGSIFAAIKLQGLRGFRGMILLPGRNYLNAILVLGMIASGIPFIIKKPISGWYLMIVFSALAAFFGFHFVTAIGGADMPVVISILNSMSGWAGVMEGFGVGNNLLITTGALVGSSGGILSYIMCRAMNRSFINVFKGGKLAKKKKKNKGEEEAKTIQEIDLDGAAEILKNAKKIIIAPGYGMAVARAQHAVSEMSKLLRSFNRDVTFGIHPVAGRLPGHMNVLLAEAQVPYDIVFSMEEVNPTIEENDVAIVIGANDTVNPAAIEDPDSIIAGMPVVEVWKTNTVIVIKRSMRAGYAGIENPLFYKENTRMLFGDAKDVVQNLFVKLKSMDLGAPKGSGAKKKDDFSTDTSDSETHNLIDKDKNGDDLMLDKVDNNLQSLHNTYMKVGVVKEIAENARIVAITPDICEKLLKYGFETLVETGAGALAKYSDTQYKRAGATILPSAEEVWKTADIILKLDPPQINEKTGVHEIDLLPENGMLVSWLWPDRNPDLIKRLQAKKATALAMDLVPRISRSQRLDARSSMAKVGGYRAVVESSYHYEKFFLGEVTAAGKYPPAIVMIIGAGVAGLAAIGTAKNLGAIVRAFDTRPVVKEQVESMGAEFLEVDMEEDGTGQGGYAKVMSQEFIEAEMRLFAQQSKEVDIIITTAQIPGKRAPLLIKREHVELMKEGSVVVDMAADSGGNCEVTQKGQIINYKGVTVIGVTDLPSRMAAQSSQMYGTNLLNLMDEMKRAKDFVVDLNNEIITGMCVTYQGEAKWPPPKKDPPKQAPPPNQAPKPQILKPVEVAAPKKRRSLGARITIGVILWIIGLAIFCVFGLWGPETFLTHLSIFVLSCIVGWTVIWNVTPALHTPLLSVTNAISGIVILGGMTLISHGSWKNTTTFFAAFSIMFASINAAGGFLVTYKMLRMFKREDETTGRQV